MTLREWLKRMLQTSAVLAPIWLITWVFFGANAATGIVILCVVTGILGTLLTLD